MIRLSGILRVAGSLPATAFHYVSRISKGSTDELSAIQLKSVIRALYHTVKPHIEAQKNFINIHEFYQNRHWFQLKKFI